VGAFQESNVMTNLLKFTLLASATALLATPALSATSGRKLSTTLTGAAEVPGPADTDGRGTATVTVNSGKRQVCYTIATQRLDKATMAHIHSGAVGVAGPPVVTLKTPVGGRSSGCATVSRDLAMKLVKSPSDYYVNVHTTAFTDGAVRGQLAK
jgi:CHRD domain